MTCVALIITLFIEGPIRMTRLKEEDINKIGPTLHAYDAHLAKTTGLTLKEISIRAAGLAEREMDDALASTRVGVIPITTGQGVIKGFIEAVGDILRHLGASVFQSEASDIGGLAEVIERGANIVFCADDRRFIGLSLLLKKVVDNSEATARGYVEALQAVVRGLKGREVLVIGGAGQVGLHAVRVLEEKGARVAVFDPDRERLISLLEGRRILVHRDLEKALRSYDILFDASPAANIIRPEHIKRDTAIAAPGIPLGLTEEAYALAKDRLIHDPLQIGVGTMLAEAISNGPED